MEMPLGSIVKHYVEQGFANGDPSVVVDEPQLAETIHKETYARTCGSYHLRECLLRDVWDQTILIVWLSKLGHEQENPGKTLFTRVEEMIDQVRLGPHTACKEER